MAFSTLYGLSQVHTCSLFDSASWVLKLQKCVTIPTSHSRFYTECERDSSKFSLLYNGNPVFQMPFTKEAVFSLVCFGCFIENYIAVGRNLDLFLGSLLSCRPLFLFPFCCCDKNAMTKHPGGGKGLFQLTFPDNSVEGSRGENKQALKQKTPRKAACCLSLLARLDS